ncbi:MAG: CpsD/CapB family tyrosine-protein kinase [Candidatus Korobacteraceae bacterium]|jgi:capsular exopolysaccharide synthesis family protein
MSRIFEALRQTELEREVLRQTITGREAMETFLPRDPAPLDAEPQPQPLPRPAMDHEAAAASELHTQPPAKASPISWVAVEAPRSSPFLDGLPAADFGANDGQRLVAINDERGLGAEKFRVLSARLINLRQKTNLKILQVTSSVVHEGKTLISVNLALTLEKRLSSSVLLIEGDLRRLGVCNLLGLSKRPGIGEWWNQEQAALRSFIFRMGSTNLYVLPGGTVSHPASILQSGRMVEGLADLAKHFDWVVIDTPPLLPMADANLWARLADGTLLVVRKAVASRKALKQALETMDSPKLIGVVLNDATDVEQMNSYGAYYKPSKSSRGKLFEEE